MIIEMCEDQTLEQLPWLQRTPVELQLGSVRLS